MCSNTPCNQQQHQRCTPSPLAGGFRLDAKDWPGGGVAAYMEVVVTQVLPWLAQVGMKHIS